MFNYIKNKNIHIWLGSYIKEKLLNRNNINNKEPIHIMFAIVDHFEPRWNNASYETEAKRVDNWVEKYPEMAKKFLDSDERHPQHTFFYPEEEYRHEYLEKLAKLCKAGFGEVEIHLHHHNDTSEGFRQKIEGFKKKLVSHGLLSKDKEGNVRYGFIHGNWALDNSRGDDKWCGVNNEITILKETGCYADFTLPSAPDISQTKKINSIYYAKDNPDKPKSHNTGIDVEAGKEASGDLMMIQGPLALNWHKRKKGIVPSIENGEITHRNLPTNDRVDLWVKQSIHVTGMPNWIFIKVHTHGAQEETTNILLNQEIERMHLYLNAKYNDKNKYFLHYVTAREMFNIIKACECGLNCNPSEYRDYILKNE